MNGYDKQHEADEEKKPIVHIVNCIFNYKKHFHLEISEQVMKLSWVSKYLVKYLPIPVLTIPSLVG